MVEFDSRKWNLYRLVLAGAALCVGACTVRDVGDGVDATQSAGGDTSAVASETAASADTGSSSFTATSVANDECTSDSDCDGYMEECIDGQCYWNGAMDGSGPSYGPCFYAGSCGPGTVCLDSGCQPVEEPSACDGFSLTAIPVESGDDALTLSFTTSMTTDSKNSRSSQRPRFGFTRPLGRVRHRPSPRLARPKVQQRTRRLVPWVPTALRRWSS